MRTVTAFLAALFSATGLHAQPSQNPTRSQAPRSVRQDVDAAFQASECTLPDKLIRRLRKQNDTIIPPALDKALASHLGNATARPINGSSVMRTMHAATYRMPDAAEVAFNVTSAATVAKLSAANLVDTQANNFIYTVDCAGFLNASLASGGGLSAAEIKQAASLALNTNSSILVAYGNLVSPIGLAFKPDLYPATVRLSANDRMDLLHSVAYAVVSKGQQDPETIVSVSQAIPTLWMSNAGTSSLQGLSKINASAGFDVGFAGFSTGLAGSNSVVRRFEYSKFTTYLFPVTDGTANKVELTLKEITDLLENYIQDQKPSNVVRALNATQLTATYQVPQFLCPAGGGRWTARSGDEVVGKANAFPLPDGGCALQVDLESEPGKEDELLLTRPSDLSESGSYRLAVSLK